MFGYRVSIPLSRQRLLICGLDIHSRDDCDSPNDTSLTWNDKGRDCEAANQIHVEMAHLLQGNQDSQRPPAPETGMLSTGSSSVCAFTIRPMANVSGQHWIHDRCLGDSTCSAYRSLECVVLELWIKAILYTSPFPA